LFLAIRVRFVVHGEGTVARKTVAKKKARVNTSKAGCKGGSAFKAKMEAAKGY
jgi:hypothetical protein